MAKRNSYKRMFAIWFSHIVQIIMNPKQFFSKIVADGNMDESMMKAFLYGLLGGIMVLVIQKIGGAELTLQLIFSKLVIVPVMAVAILFVLGGMLMMVSEITGGERDWEIAIKGLASVFFIYPVILVLNSLAWGCVSLWVISAIVDIYVLFLLYNIAVYCMKGNRTRVLIVIGAFAFFMLTVYATDYRFGWLSLKNYAAALECYR
ncbi:MAG: hypothetical protein FWG39_00485 [Alphaproteobacteria bacterium]|nr:hypothetical protein [Alphaproteobacteria bacterium]